MYLLAEASALTPPGGLLAMRPVLRMLCNGYGEEVSKLLTLPLLVRTGWKLIRLGLIRMLGLPVEINGSVSDAIPF